MDEKMKKDDLKPVNSELSDKDLDEVSGGVIPTPVNGQITDAIT